MDDGTPPTSGTRDSPDDVHQAGTHAQTVRARGHEQVRATHESTLEVTSDEYLTPAGDCIVAIGADRTPVDFESDFVAACRDPDATITATIEAGGQVDQVTGRGHPDLSFGGDRSLVCRTSDYVDDRTVMVDADRAAAALDRELVAALSEGADCRLTLAVE